MDTYSIVSYLPVVGRIRTNFYNSAAKTYEIYDDQNEFNRQKLINHLGLISRVFDSANHTRHEYLMLQCALVDMVDSLNKGESQVALGRINTAIYEYLGNPLLKTWFMLSNFGHFKNTYGDLKTLLQLITKNNNLKNTLLNTIKDKQLRQCCKSIIETYNYRKFNYVIAIYRLYKLYPHRQKKTLQLHALKLFLIEEADYPELVTNWPKLHRLRRIHSTIRDIAILFIDGHYTHTSVSIDLISAITSLADFEHAYNDAHLSDSLKPVLSLLNQEIYLDKKTVAMQRTYEIKATQENDGNSNLDEIISRGLCCGLFSIEITCMTHFLRVKLPREALESGSVPEEFKNISKLKEGCSHIELSIDKNHYDNYWYIDILVDEQNIESKEIGLVYHRISKLVVDCVYKFIRAKSEALLSLNKSVIRILRSAGVNESVHKEILQVSKKGLTPVIFEAFQESADPSYKSLLYSALSYLFEDKYKIDLEHAHSSYKSFDFCFDTGVTDDFTSNITRAMNINYKDPDRVHEINVLKKQIKSTKGYFVYICLDRLLILDMSVNPESRKYTDLDGVALFVSEEEARLEIIEAKNTKHPETDAKKDIRKRILPALKKSKIKGYRIRPLKKQGAKLIIKFD